MIFVTVGTHTRKFTRLINAMDEVAEDLSEEVIIQIGNSTVTPKNTTYFRYATYSQIETWTDQARIVVSHAGAGSIILTLSRKRPLIVVPRYKKFGEHMDDHQLELANALDRSGLAVVVYDLTSHSIYEAIQKAPLLTHYSQDTNNLKVALHDQLCVWESQL